MFSPLSTKQKLPRTSSTPSSSTKSLPWPLALSQLSIHSFSSFWELAWITVEMHREVLSSQQRHSRRKDRPLNRCWRKVVVGAAIRKVSESLDPTPSGEDRSLELWGLNTWTWDFSCHLASFFSTCKVGLFFHYEDDSIWKTEKSYNLVVPRKQSFGWCRPMTNEEN